MKHLVKTLRRTMLMAVMLVMVAGFSTFASDDNSLADLGITTEGVTVTPDFSYDTWTYDVTVPAGTTEIALSPVPSSDSATIAEVSGTTLNADGTGTVYITVRAASGAEFTYTLNVTGGGAAPAPETEPPTEAPQPVTEAPQPATEPPTEPQTEDSRFVRVDKNTIQEAENTITSLKSDIAKYRDTISLYTKIMYGLIAVAVLLLFIVINLILRKRDLKAELNDYRSLSGNGGKKGKAAKAKKEKKSKAGAQPQAAPALQAGARGGMPRPNPMTGQAPAQGVHPNQISGQGNYVNPNTQRVPQGQVSGQIRQGQIQYRTPGGALDVQPQTSSRRKLPEYQKENVTENGGTNVPGMENAAPAAPAAPQASAEPAPETAARGERKNVEVDMIEL